MKQLLLTCALTAGTIMSASAGFTADLDGVEFTIDTIYHQVVGPGVTRTALKLTSATRGALVYTSTMSRKAGATAGVVEPRVVIGNDRCANAETVSSMARRQADDPDTRYLTGINGDFFITSAFASGHEFGSAILGYPNMACAIDGELAAPDMIDVTSRENALIVCNDNWYIDATDFKYRLLNNDGSTIVDATAVNYPRRAGELMIYNHYMGATTCTDGSGRELVLKMAEGAEWQLNKSVKFIVDGEWIAGGNTAIPTDGIVISCGANYANEWIDGLKDGDIVKMKLVMSLPAHDKIKPQVRHIIGGDVRILNQGQITREAIRWINTPSSPYQRSLVGFSEDRDMMTFAAVDGTGLNYYESAALMKALGCYDALDFDGGGSTAIWSDAFGIYNRPRDGAERAVGNALFFTLNAPVDKTVTSIAFADYKISMPCYGTYTPTIFGYNKYGQLVDTDVKGFTLDVPAEMGSVSSDGTSVTATQKGLFPVRATLDGMTATVCADVAPATGIKCKFAATVIDNFHPVNVSLYSIVNGNEMAIAPEVFEWSSDNEAVATVDAHGVITGISDGAATIKGVLEDNTIEISVVTECPTAHKYPLNSSDWKKTASGVTVNALTPAEDGSLTIDYKITNSRAPRITLQQDITLWSRPDAIEITFDKGTAEYSSIAVLLTPNGLKPVTVTKDEVKEVLRYDISEYLAGQEGNEAVYPLHLSSIVLRPSSPTGTYTSTIKSIKAIYDAFEDGVTDVAISDNTVLPVVIGRDIICANASDMCLYDISGNLVAHVSGTTVTAPESGLFVVVARGNSGVTACKIAVK